MKLLFDEKVYGGLVKEPPYCVKRRVGKDYAPHGAETEDNNFPYLTCIKFQGNKPLRFSCTLFYSAGYVANYLFGGIRNCPFWIMALKFPYITYVPYMIADAALF